MSWRNRQPLSNSQYSTTTFITESKSTKTKPCWTNPATGTSSRPSINCALEVVFRKTIKWITIIFQQRRGKWWIMAILVTHTICIRTLWASLPPVQRNVLPHAIRTHLHLMLQTPDGDVQIQIRAPVDMHHMRVAYTQRMKLHVLKSTNAWMITIGNRTIKY